MALSTLENKVANRIVYGSLLAGSGALGAALFTDNSTNIAMAGTGAYILGGASFTVSRLYDHAGQKIAVWQTLRTSAKAVSIATAQDVEKIAARLQHLEHAIDHRVDVIADSSRKNGKSAMGAWVHAAKQVLTKAQLFDVAESPVDRDPVKLKSNWPTVARQIEVRMAGYSRMLKNDKANPLSETICNFEYPSL